MSEKTLLERLRHKSVGTWIRLGATSEAADKIESLTAEIERLRDEWYPPAHMDAVQDRTIDPMRVEIEQLTKVNEEYLECLDIAKYDEPELRADNYKLREVLKYLENLLSRRPFSCELWPTGEHPQDVISKVRDVLTVTTKSTHSNEMDSKTEETLHTALRDSVKIVPTPQHIKDKLIESLPDKGNKIVRCPNCNSYFQREEDLEAHMRLCLIDITVPLPEKNK